MHHSEILTFWFEELTPKQHFVSDEKLDAEIKNRFSEIHTHAINSELAHWRDSPEGRLAEILVLDQFSRNMFRGDSRSWSQDQQALELAKAAIEAGDDMKIVQTRRAFIYMPFMHSESAEIHEEAVILFEKLGNEENLKYELLHKKVIDTFGRYPYRNKVLGRESTPAEIEYLKTNKGF